MNYLCAILGTASIIMSVLYYQSLKTIDKRDSTIVELRLSIEGQNQKIEQFKANEEHLNAELKQRDKDIEESFSKVVSPKSPIYSQSKSEELPNYKSCPSLYNDPSGFLDIFTTRCETFISDLLKAYYE